MPRLSNEQASETTPLLGAASLVQTASQGASFPRSRQEAINDIEEIRRNQEHRLGDEEYQRMLKLLSDGQNTNVSRFLYELLQNADDAHYGSKTPRVIIRYSSRHVLFESNEIGFSKANLNSICRATMSTKRGDENTKERRSIGEKGIGFKSVFMVATSVWINSGYYSFRFDGNTPLGRVRPIWDEDWPSPLGKSRGFTSILLILPDKTKPPKDMKIVDPSEVISVMKDFDPTDLLFLSQVKHVHIQLVDDTSMAKKIMGTTRWQTILKVDAITETPNVLMNLETNRDGVAESHVVLRYSITGLPPTSDRPNLTTSEIILLFAQNINISNDRPIVPSRKTYAFLPIRNYNFKFTIHSDFILVSNREDMEPVQWNREIVRKIPHALAEAVGQFRGDYPDLWLKWPLLLPLDGLGGDIFRILPDEIKNVFSTKEVLEDANGRCLRPQDLRIVPIELRDKHGIPFIPDSSSKHHILSEKYPRKVQDKLIELGVPYLSYESFLEDLSTFISTYPTEFAKKSDSWHDELCELLLELLKSPKYRKVIENLNLVPLSSMLPNGDRQWVSSKFGKLYFPVETRGLKLPPGIKGMYEIHQDVTNNTHQAKLCRELGARDAQLHDLCDYVILQHTDSFMALFTWSHSDMVSHLVFLYQSRWKPPDGPSPDLWYVCKDGGYRRQHEIYQECDDQYSAKYISNLEHYRRELHFLHPLYLSTFRKFQDGSKWLDETMGLRKRLRLTKTSLFGAHKLHDDFQSLLAENPLEALELLRHNWPFYRSWFVNEHNDRLSSSEGHDAPLSLDSKARENLRSCVSNTKFPCHSPPGDPVTSKLRNMYLAREELLLLCEQDTFPRCERPVRQCRSCNFMSSLRLFGPRKVARAIVDSGRLLGVQNPDHKDWDFLETFGVFVKTGGRLFIEHLNRIRGTEVTYDHMKHLYKQLERFAVGTMMSNILAALTEPNSIYIPISASSGKWVDFSSVVWDGPSSLRYVTRLISFYEPRFYLFQTVLGIPIADLATLEIEVKNLVPENIDHIVSVLRSIPQYLEPWNQPSPVVANLPQWRMFPVNPKGPTPGQVELKTASDLWCIPVTLDHQKGFFGKVALSVIFADTFSEMPGLCRHLKLSSKFMSSLISKKSAHYRGDHLHQGYTERLRGKAFYIASLIPSRYDRTKYANLLKNLAVYQSNQILISWRLEVGEERVQSHPVENQVTAEIKSGTFVIHMVDKNGLLNSGYSPIQLSHVMGDICKIKDSRDFGLLIQILAQDKPQLIEADLDAHLKETGRARLEEPFDSGSDVIGRPHAEMSPPQEITISEEMANKGKQRKGFSSDDQKDDTLSDNMQEPINEEINQTNSGSVPKFSKNSPEGQIQNPVGKILVDTSGTMVKTDGHLIIDRSDLSKDLNSVPAGREDGGPEEKASANGEKSTISSVVVSAKADMEASHRDGAATGINKAGSNQIQPFGNEQIHQESKDENIAVVFESSTAEQESLTAEQESSTLEQESLTAEQESSTAEQESSTAEQESSTAEQGHLLENLKVYHVKREIADAAGATPKEGSNIIRRHNASDPQSGQQEEPPGLNLEDESVRELPNPPPAASTTPASGEGEENVDMNSSVLDDGTGETFDQKMEHHVPKRDQAPTSNAQAANKNSYDNQEPGHSTLSGISIAIERAEPSETKESAGLGFIETHSDGFEPSPNAQGNQQGQSQRETGRLLRTMRQPSPYVQRVPSPSRYLPSSDRETDYTPRRLRSSTSHEFMNMNKGFVQYHQPTTFFTGRDTEETRYFGELYVSEYLRKLLSETYNPSKHWTSRQYSKSFTPPTADCSTFTIPDASGKLMEAVLHEGQISKNLLEEPCTIHVQVCVSNNDLQSSFVIPNVQFEKARRMTIRKDRKVNQVYILARVYKVQDDPGIAMYVDPWRLYLDESISLESESRYLGAISKSNTPRPILHQESTRESFSTKSHVIHRDLPVGLHEIRLLKLDLNGENEPLSGSLQVRDVSDAKHCWALSYVWGPNPTELHPIYFTVDGKQIMITESLSAFLKQLRWRLRDGGTDSVPPLLWADGLCIDQKNNVEKSQQVSSMGSIYGRAKRVIVWMGTEKDEDAGVIELLAWLHEQLYGHQNTGTCRCRDEGKPSTHSLPGQEDPCWPAMEAFLRREWFVRVWIIQELVLGSEVIVMYGEREIRWDCFAQTLRVCERYLNQGANGRRYLPSSGPALSLDGVRKFYQGHRKRTFLELLEMFYLSRSTWRRDRFFALLSLASDDDLDTGDFQPDYESSDEKVLAKYARGFVRLGLAPNLLYRAGSGKACPSSSWIPDFMRLRAMDPQYPPTISTWEARSGPFCAGSRIERKKPDVHFLTPPSEGKSTSNIRPVLAIQGYEIDIVAGCQSLNINPIHMSLSFKTLNVVRNHLKFYLRGRSENPVVQLLIGDALRPQSFYAGQGCAELDEWPPGFEEKLLQAMDPYQDGREYDKTQTEDRILNLQFWATVRDFIGRIPDAAVCFTEKGHAGIVPGNARPGDKIVAIQGAAVPFVVGERPNVWKSMDRDSPRYLTLIGECYVDSLMYFDDSSVTGQPEDMYLV